MLIHSAAGYFTEENDNKYLILGSTNILGDVWSEIKAEIKRINGKKDLFSEKIYSRIKVDADNNFPMNKTRKFLTLTKVLKLFFKRVKNCFHKFI